MCEKLHPVVEFRSSEEAAEFLVDLACEAEDVLICPELSTGNYPMGTPGTRIVEFGARVVELALKQIDSQVALEINTELVLLHMYFDSLIKECRKVDGDFLLNNLRWAQEVEHEGLNQPSGRLMMFAQMISTRESIAERITS